MKPKNTKKHLRSVYVWLRNLRAWNTSRANRDLQRAMQKDPDFAHTWQCNIAMPILDGADGRLTPKEANEIADRLMEHLFNVKMNAEVSHGDSRCDH